MTRKIDHTHTKCVRCGSNDTFIKSGGNPLWHAYRGEDHNIEWDGKSYACTKCNSKIRNNLRNSAMNIIKSMRKYRTGQTCKYDNNGGGIIVEMVVAKIRKLKNNNIESNNFNVHFDLSIDPEYGRPEVKGPTLQKERERWGVNTRMEHEFDTLFVLCMDMGRKNVERVYIIPESELYGETQILIYRDWKKARSEFEWIEKFRVSKEIENIYNEIYHSLMSYIGDRKFLNVDDINKWLDN